ncbi:MAG TPA: Hsp20/alpha crystallin family protein [Fimbriimonadaceae bacterium]|nr:Hsp20/alpha crystallin family protein [Fimbriimonadaceae bacterium]
MSTTLLPTTTVGPFERLNQMMEELFPSTPLLVPRTLFPPVDIKETDKELTFVAEIPGMLRENIEVEMVGDTLILKGKKEEERTEEKEGWVRKERSHGSFQRSFRLDVPVKAEEITAEYKEGLLKVVLPKLEVVKPQKITVRP